MKASKAKELTENTLQELYLKYREKIMIKIKNQISKGLKSYEIKNDFFEEDNHLLIDNLYSYLKELGYVVKNKIITWY